ncbi:MAG: HD domain-containing protein [Bacteroidales bacterium]|jgi:HD superfamily phosphohydrolase|nr:HD domain-containing protein [Bacteroidales bacterium]MDD4703541.1 HD domain-containing protein [Bacteroidales bacterium]
MNDFVNRKKIINDPVYGFINIPLGSIFDLLEHPYLQRLRRIKQLGLSDLVYPGAQHSRFAHSLGAMFLMNQALDVLRQKDQKITDKEIEASLTAILLHDIGHSPFSHCLEHFFFEETHEEVSLELMKMLGVSKMAIDIFSNKYSKHFLHQLVSSQLDTDRLDYLTRDSFFTGVSEGVIGTERIIKMLSVKDDELVVEQKGIYSIEKFIISRRLMYWQVYMHKAVVSADILVKTIIKRAREIQGKGIDLTKSISPYLAYFIQNGTRTIKDIKAIEYFTMIDDSDIWNAIKVWANSEDFILSYLSTSLMNRKLGKMQIQDKPFSQKDIEDAVKQFDRKHNLTKDEVKSYFILTDELKNKAYSFQDDRINILYKNKEVKEISSASDQLDKRFLSKEIKKYYLYKLSL